MMGIFDKIFRKKTIDPNDLEAIISAYGKALENPVTSVIRDVSDLPLEKPVIKLALLQAINMTPAGPMREQLRTGYVTLADFQDLAACAKRGLDPAKQMVAEGEQLLAELRQQEAAE